MLPVLLKFADGKEKSLLLPTGFDELTADQFVKCIELINAADQDPSMQWRLLMFVSKIQYEDLAKLNAVQRVELLSQLGFLFDMNALPHKSKIPKFWIQQRMHSVAMAGPGDTLKHLTFGEFMMAEARLETWERSSDPAMLNQLCGVLYRPEDKRRRKEQDKRIPYSEGTVAYYGDLFKGANRTLKHAILLNYFGATQYLPKMYPHVFPQPAADNAEQGAKPKGPKSSVSLSWLNMLFRTAGWDVTKIKATEQTPMHTVLFGLNDMLQANKK